MSLLAKFMGADTKVQSQGMSRRKFLTIVGDVLAVSGTYAVAKSLSHKDAYAGDSLVDMESMTMPDLTGYELKKSRMEDVTEKISGAETKVDIFLNNDYIIRTYALSDGQIYGLGISDRKTSKRSMLIDVEHNGVFKKLPNYDTKFELDHKVYGIE